MKSPQLLAIIKLNDKNWKFYLSDQEQDKNLHFGHFLFNTGLEVLAMAIWAREKKKVTKLERKK